jgi:hypothetical protein
VSPWRRERLLVGLSPERLRLQRVSGGRVVDDDGVLDWPVEAIGNEPWRGTVEALGRVLEESAGASVRVRLSGHFVRWLLLPASEHIAGDAEWESYARIEMQAIHGERAHDWVLRVSEPRPGESVPACAIDRALCEAVDATCVAAGSRLQSLEPAFCVAFEARRTALRAPASALAHLEPGRLTLGLLLRQRWVALSSVRCGERWLETLESELALAAAGGALPVAPGRLHVVADGLSVRVPASIGGWEVFGDEDLPEARRVAWRWPDWARWGRA